MNKTFVSVLIIMVTMLFGVSVVFSYGGGGGDPPPDPCEGVVCSEQCTMCSMGACISTGVYIPETGLCENDCFVGETKVLMAGGISKNINDIVLGDFVVSYNETTKENELSRVIKTFVHENKERMYLLINDVLGVTPNHPMWINGRWLPIGSATAGDTLMNSNSEGVKIDSIIKIDKSLPVYNLEVEGNHNYYANGFLAHNKLSIPIELEAAASLSCGGKVHLYWGKTWEVNNFYNFPVDGFKTLTFKIFKNVENEKNPGEPLMSVYGITSIDVEAKSTDVFMVEISGWSGLSNPVSATPSTLCGLVLTAATSPICGGKIRLSWNSLTGAIRYNIYKNGQQIETTTATSFDVEGKATDVFQVAAIF